MRWGVAAAAIACMSFAAVAASATDDPLVIAILRAKLALAQRELAVSRFDPTQPPVQCSCEGYCTGRCFAPQCAPCPASTWSYPGGEANCLTAEPLGAGLLCAVDAATGNLTGNACCSATSPSCRLDPTSCCGDGTCGKCPKYAPQPAGVFPGLNRTFVDGQCLEEH